MLCWTILDLTTTIDRLVAGGYPPAHPLRGTTMKPSLDFSAIERAGLTQQEFANLVNVTRVTVNHWVNGGMPANFLKKVVRNYLEDLELAIERQWLPNELQDIPKSDTAQRQEVLDDVLVRVAMVVAD